MGRLQELFNGAGARALDQGQVDLLDVLVQRDGWRMAELADAMRVDASTATRSVDRLVAARLAARSASDEDGRVVIVSATAAGRARQGEVSARRIAALEAMLAKFNVAEQRRFAEYLERLVSALDEVTAPVDDDLERSGSRRGHQISPGRA